MMGFWPFGRRKSSPASGDLVRGYDATSGEECTFAASTLLSGLLIGSATYDAASLLDGAGATTTVPVTGAALGDFVVAVSHGVDLQGIIVTGYVSAADTVSVRFQNESTGTLDLASSTLRVIVLPKASAGF